jgi:hypothetical protein
MQPILALATDFHVSSRTIDISRLPVFTSCHHFNQWSIGQYLPSAPRADHSRQRYLPYPGKIHEGFWTIRQEINRIGLPGLPGRGVVRSDPFTRSQMHQTSELKIASVPLEIAWPVLDQLPQLIDAKWLGQNSIHSGCQAFLLIFCTSVGGQAENAGSFSLLLF